MPLITETYYLSLTQDNRGILRLRCSQDDTLRTVNLKLYNNGSIFTIPSGISAYVSGVKQNGAVFSKSCTISQDRKSVVLQLSSVITNVDGVIIAEIVLNDGNGDRLGTSNFIIQVEKNPIRAGVVQDTETPIEYINDFIEKIQTLTARLNNLITPSGDASLAEVVDARIGILDSTTYQTLGARLNAEFQRLSNALSGITILESTGDTTDRTSEILSKLNAYGTCKLGKGDFYVNSLVMPEGSHLVGSGNSTRIILPSSVTSGYVVKPRSNCIIENISFYGGFTGTYSELIASGSIAQRHCIILDRFNSVSSENVILNNIFINNFVGSAIIQRYTVGCHCEDVIIDMCYAGIDISNASYDGQLVNISMSNTRFGVVQNGSNFVFTNCVSKDSAYHIMSDQQNTGCTFSSCSFSESSLETTSKLASISNAREGFVFDNCLFDSSLSMLLNACDGIVIKGTNFVGSDTFAITVSNGRNTLLLITDCIADVEPVVTNAGTAARITSCYLKDGIAWSISEADITVDDELSDESENPVQNKVINRKISEIKADLQEELTVSVKNTEVYAKQAFGEVVIVEPTWENGIIINGQDGVSNTNRRTVGKIKLVDSNTVHVVCDVTTITAYLVEYDKDGVYIGTSSGRDITSSDNCVYFRVLTYSSTVPQTEQDGHISITINTHDSIEMAKNAIADINTRVDESVALLSSGSVHPAVVWENGIIINGQDGNGDKQRRTHGYISVGDYDFVANLTKPGTTSLSMYLCEYDATKTYLGVTSRNNTGDLTPQNDQCKFVRVWTYSNTVAQNEQESYITLTIINSESVSNVVNSVSEKIDVQQYNNALHAFDLLNSSVLYRADRIEIGATHNNESGNTTYIYKTIVLTSEVGCVWIRIKEISNARNKSVIAYFYNSATVQNAETLFASQQISDTCIKEGTLIIPPAGTLSILIRLYPSVNGGLTETYAVYSDILIGLTKYRINPIDLIRKEENAVPYYYFQNDYLKNKIAVIRQTITESEGNYDAFIFCTDQHWGQNARNSPSLIRYLSDGLNIKRLFNGGDFANGINIDALKAFKKSINGAVYNICGNHEYMNYLEEDCEQVAYTITEDEVWLYLNGGLTDAVIGDPRRQYYYVDNPTQKMRYIILSVFADNGASAIGSFDTAQQTWFSDVALNMPTGYTAVIFAHTIYNVHYDDDTLSTYPVAEPILNIADAYNGAGEIACLIQGHTHVDGMTVTSGGIPVFITTCDKYLPWINNGTNMEPNLTANRHLGTITEQAFDVVVVDKTNKKVSCIRIGAPADNGTGAKLEIRQQNYGT